jgi:hypothetical protein
MPRSRWSVIHNNRAMFAWKRCEALASLKSGRLQEALKAVGSDSNEALRNEATKIQRNCSQPTPPANSGIFSSTAR